MKTLMKGLVLACAALLSASAHTHTHTCTYTHAHTHTQVATIHASSPGLKEATLDINSEGLERFVAAPAPIAKPRPASCYPAAAKPETGAAPPNIGINWPTADSSTASGHRPSLPNDDNGAAYWQVAPPDANSYWSADLENTHEPKAVTVLQRAQAEPGYKLEVSLARPQWLAVTPAQRSGMK